MLRKPRVKKVEQPEAVTVEPVVEEPAPVEAELPPGEPVSDEVPPLA